MYNNLNPFAGLEFNSINILDPIKVDYYGSLQPLKSIAQISVPEAQAIVIQPFDPNSLELIEKSTLFVEESIQTFSNTAPNLIAL